MPRFAMIMSLAAFVLFNYGQYRGWSLFSAKAPTPSRCARPTRRGLSTNERKPMQILLISGIGVAIVAVLFALQNNVPVTISFFAWSFGGSLALVLLMALGLGVLIAGLVTSPALIGSQWSGKRLRRQVATLEEQNRALQQRVAELDAQLESLLAAQALAPTTALIEQKP
jgi:putative membrane protein